MKQEERKDFDKEAVQWDANPGRLKLAQDVADAMIQEVSPAKDQDALDFGCGTGLVTLKLQPLVRSITGVDTPPTRPVATGFPVGASRKTPAPQASARPPPLVIQAAQC